MSNLVAYDSSDEEDVLNIMNEQSQGHPPSEFLDGTAHGSLRPSGPSNEPDLSSLCANGAMLGPAGPPSPTSQNSNTISSPSSPYTSQRATIRSLTLPADPNLDIPPSPPGSPTPGADQKFVHFLKLKKQGVHFNAKLASSSALKNPSLLPKLMNFAGVEEQKQYATTLPMPLWDPAGFSNWAYKEELAKDQQMVAKRKEEERSRGSREIDFVSATNSVHSSRAGTPGLANGLRGAKGSAAERIMADLDRRGGRPDTARSRGSSRSPKRRKRSRSR
ncbi:hypothetical protein P7C71_g4078, partial [Lecanoromycetidae sp. Uapishka_2]